MNPERDDLKTLLSRMRDGSQDAAWEVVERYGPHIRAVVRRKLSRSLRSAFDSDDFVQAVWVSFVRARPKLDKIERPAQLIALLATMARNKIVDQARRKKLHDEAMNALFPGVVDSPHARTPRSADKTTSASQIAIVREQWERMLQRKPDHYRKVLEMRLTGATYVSIGEKLSLNEKTVRRIVSRLLSTRLK